MKKIIALSILLILFTKISVFAQNFDKMNKNELRDYSNILLGKIDSLNTKITSLEESEKQLQKSLKSSEEKNNFMIQDKKKLEGEIVEKEKEINKLNVELKSIKDLYSNLEQSLLTNSSIQISDSDDFLNNYYFKPFPLDNNSFSLTLSKVILGSENSNSLPEILPADAFTYWGVKPNLKITDGSKFNDFLFPQSVDYYNSRLPKIEFLKNKLMTITNKDGKEESFIFTSTPVDKSKTNNGRLTFQFNLVSESKIDNDDNYYGDNAKNLIWEFYAIENEVYLALKFKQLNRINSELKGVEFGIEAYSESSQKMVMAKYLESRYRQITSGNGVYLSRKTDAFMPVSTFINPIVSEPIFLFKLSN
jgi:hypothetical protein